MSFKCKMGIHSWNGCKCSKCGKYRDSNHRLGIFGDVCKICYRSLSFDQLVELLNNEDKYERSSAAGVLGKMKDERAIKHLCKALTDKDGTVRSHAAEALGILGKTYAVDSLIKSLQNDKDSHVRKESALALGKICDSRGVEPLIKALETNTGNSRKEVREAALIALGQIKDIRATAPITKALKDSDSWVRLRAQEAFDKLSITRSLAIEAQRIMADADNPSLPHFMPIFHDFSKIAIPRLIAMLDESGQSASDTVGISILLGQKRSVEAIPALVKTLRKWDPNGNEITSPPWYSIVWALGQIGEYCGIESDFLSGSDPIVPVALAKLQAYNLLFEYLEKKIFQGFHFTNSYYFDLEDEIFTTIVLLSTRPLKNKYVINIEANNEIKAYTSFLGSPNCQVRWAVSEALSKLGVSYWKENMKCCSGSNKFDFDFLLNSDHPHVKDAIETLSECADSYDIREIALKRLKTLT